MYTETRKAGKLQKAGGAIRRFTTIIPAAVLFLVQTAWAQTAPEDFEMLVYDDTPQGRRISAGEWSDALAMDAKGAIKSFDKFNNRCVLYTMTREFAEAEAACNAAIETRAMDSTTASQWRNAARKRMQTAMALTNRGVLRAVTGDVSGAKEDFEAVISANSKTRAARANLTILEARTTELANRVAAN